MTSIATPAAGLEQLHDVERTIHHLAGRPAVGRVAHLTKGRGATPYFYRKSLRQLSGGPLIGALDADPHDPAQRGASFWYLVAGGLLAALGWNAQRAEANGKPPSAEFAVSLSALGSVGAVASPASPLWAVLAIGLLATYRRRRARSEGHVSRQPCLVPLDAWWPTACRTSTVWLSRAALSGAATVDGTSEYQSREKREPPGEEQRVPEQGVADHRLAVVAVARAPARIGQRRTRYRR